MSKAGKDGVVTVEESRTSRHARDVEGMQFDRGYCRVLRDGPERMEAVLEDPLILTRSGKIRAVADFAALLERVAGTGQPLVIIAEDVRAKPLATLVVNQVRGTPEGGRGQGPAMASAARACSRDVAVSRAVSHHRGTSGSNPRALI